MATTDADFARFTEIDLDEATSRLTRLAACYRARLSTVDGTALDAVPEDAGWTLRQVVHHVSRVTGYAGMLSGQARQPAATRSSEAPAGSLATNADASPTTS